MINYSAAKRAVALSLLSSFATLLFAVDTRTWEQSDAAEFARGTRKGLSIRSDGRLMLAPEFKELDSTSVPYLWTLAQDSKGTIFYAGGAPTGTSTKIFALSRGGKPKTYAEVTGLEVHSLAIDQSDRVYAAVLPDAKIYRLKEGAKPELFFDPKCKYIWAMTFDRAGDLFVATGDAGLIYKVTPDGKGTKFFDTQETHARSMIIDGSGNLIIGTEPGGLVLRVSPAGQSFVLYQTNKREVTALAEHDDLIYAAGIGSKTATPSVSGAPPVLPSASPSITATGTPRSGTAPPSLAPAIGSLSASVTGGSDLYRIHKDGSAERIWNSTTDLVYALAIDDAGKPILGTGNKGTIFRIDSDQLSTDLLTAPPTQVTAFLKGANGTIYAATGNVGNLYSIGPPLETNGTLESEVLDANDFAYWGKAHLTPALHPGAVALETRSGNLSNPQNSWSPWTPVEISEHGGTIASPAARFLQYRLTLNRAAGDGASPEVSAVDIPFLPKNVAPRIQQIDIAPFNYRQPPSTNALERSVAASGSPMTLTVPAVGQKKSSVSSLSLETAGSATLQYSKGFLTVRWNATDPNNDSLAYRLEIRDKNGKKWQLLKDKLQDRFYSFDTTAFPDGQYVVRITASDAPGNTPANALTSFGESDPFMIDNTPPEIADLKCAEAGGRVQVTFTARDARSWIDKAEYSLDAGEWTLIEPVNKVSDSQILSYKFDVPAGRLVAVRVFDEDDNVAVRQVNSQ